MADKHDSRYWTTSPVHPEKVVDWFLGLHHYWFDGSLGPNAFTGMRDLAVAYLYQWVEIGDLPPDNTMLEIHLASKFGEWLDSSWTTIAPPQQSAAFDALYEAVRGLRSDIANRTARYESEREQCKSGSDAWQRIEAMRVTAANILFQLDATLADKVKGNE